ncbi:ALDH-like protein [Periconia macrospinosa]|uniref:ALDH-like protein n=1 Tax=Periconia macrospinosa TaxID=97972 RepID=A0A2V1E4M7_9PLEO|nr:ALDH-like protein [Periconia macrospinosa]
MAPSTTPDAAVEILLGTSRTTRCHNSLFRQQQLKFLHDVLRNNVQDIREAIKRDTGAIDAEVTTEIAVVLNVVKEHYAGIDPKKELDEEYKVKKREDAGGRKVPWGVVYIEPELRHTPFFSIVVPLCVAVAAGNCVVLKLETTSQSLPGLLRTFLTQALESDTFQIVTSSPSPSATIQCFTVLQNDKETPKPTYSQLVSSSGRVIAVVDRTADLSTAASHLVTARFAYGGASPYAPDLILVNEFAKREFLEHVLKHAMRFLFPTSNNTSPPSSSSHNKPAKAIQASLAALEQDPNWTLSLVSQGQNGAAIGELTCSSQTIVPLPPKVDTPLFCIHAITSLDHAVDLVSSDSDEQLLAAYHFAAPAHTKYLSQFIKADISFANYVSSSLLLGPAAPVGHQINQLSRYTKDQFVRSSPVYVASSATSPGTSSKEAEALLSDAIKEIKPKKRAEWMSLGFFEQGILLGLGTYGIPILTCLAASVYFGVRVGVRKWSA